MNEFKGWFSTFAWIILAMAFTFTVVGLVSRHPELMMSSGSD